MNMEYLPLSAKAWTLHSERGDDCWQREWKTLAVREELAEIWLGEHSRLPKTPETIDGLKGFCWSFKGIFNLRSLFTMSGTIRAGASLGKRRGHQIRGKRINRAIGSKGMHTDFCGSVMEYFATVGRPCAYFVRRTHHVVRAVYIKQHMQA